MRFLFHFEATMLYCNNSFQLYVSNSISKVNYVLFFASNMVLPVKGELGTDRQHWFQAGSI